MKEVLDAEAIAATLLYPFLASVSLVGSSSASRSRSSGRGMGVIAGERF
jgi:hypothetical protein